MTSSVPVTTIFEYVGDGLTVEFSFPLRFLENADVEVYVDGTLQPGIEAADHRRRRLDRRRFAVGRCQGAAQARWLPAVIGAGAILVGLVLAILPKKAEPFTGEQVQPRSADNEFAFGVDRVRPKKKRPTIFGGR